MDHNDTPVSVADDNSADTTTIQGGVSRRAVSAIGTAFLATMWPVGAMLASPEKAQAQTAITDVDILNFALNLEYLEAEFYLRAFTGQGLPSGMVTGTGTLGGVNGGSQVPFKNTFYTDIAANLALNEQQHVGFLRSALGASAVGRPTIDLAGGFQGAALAAGVISAGQVFNPFADEQSFLLGSFIFEDVGVTAYAGAAALIQNKSYLAAAASILAVEAYHAGVLRAALAEIGGAIPFITQAIANLRSRASNAVTDAGVLIPGSLQANISLTDGNGLCYRRTPAQVLNIVTNGGQGRGGFFPYGVNGNINSGVVTS